MVENAIRTRIVDLAVQIHPEVHLGHLLSFTEVPMKNGIDRMVNRLVKLRNL